jgi:hypothetical protein
MARERNQQGQGLPVPALRHRQRRIPDFKPDGDRIRRIHAEPIKRASMEIDRTTSMPME